MPSFALNIIHIIKFIVGNPVLIPTIEGLLHIIHHCMRFSGGRGEHFYKSQLAPSQPIRLMLVIYVLTCDGTPEDQPFYTICK